MPFYEYECSACGHYLEALQKISDPPLKKCPSCGKSKLAKLVSAPVFRLKGAGWYETDFKSEGETKRNLAEHAEAKEAESKTDSKDQKPAGTEAASEPPKPAAATSASAKKPAAQPAVKAKKSAKPKPAARKKAARR